MSCFVYSCHATRRDGNGKKNAAQTAGALAKPKAFPMQAEGHFAHFFAREKVGRSRGNETPSSVCFADSFIPTPSVALRHLPLTGGVGPQGGRLCLSLRLLRRHLPRQREAFEVRGKKSERKPRNCFREEEEAQRSDRDGLRSKAAKDTELAPTRGRLGRQDPLPSLYPSPFPALPLPFTVWTDLGY